MLLILIGKSLLASVGSEMDHLLLPSCVMIMIQMTYLTQYDPIDPIILKVALDEDYLSNHLWRSRLVLDFHRLEPKPDIPDKKGE